MLNIKYVASTLMVKPTGTYYHAYTTLIKVGSVYRLPHFMDNTWSDQSIYGERHSKKSQIIAAKSVSILEQHENTKTMSVRVFENISNYWDCTYGYL
jgi:hypothetical protein